MSFAKNNWSYLAGFLDGDGSIYVQLKPNQTYRFGFQIALTVAFFQSKKEKVKIEAMKNLYGLGYLRERKDGIIEWIIGKKEEIKKVLEKTIPFLLLKKKQAELMLKILDLKSRIKNRQDFIFLANKIELFRELNYSKKRKRRVISPVETESRKLRDESRPRLLYRDG